jgi:HEPN domain-containing protein
MARLRREVDLLLRQARRDLVNAEKNVGIDAYEVAAFLCQQSVEKALKALYVHTRKKRASATHSLTELGTDLSAPAALKAPLSELSPDYTVSRYPDAANGLPADVYTRATAESRLTAAKEIWTWVERQL